MGLSLLFVLGGVSLAALRAETPLSAEDVIQKAVDHAQRAEASSGPAYSYTKLSVTEELDAAGKVKERKEKVYQVIFQEGTTRLKLLAVNGHAPAETDLKQQRENENNARQLSPSKSKRKERRENLLTPEIVARFAFNLVEKTEMNGRETYRIAFQPRKPEQAAHGVVDRLLNRISGMLWIDAQEFEIARADIQLGSEVNLVGGLVGTLRKLAYTVTRTRIADGVWFDTSSSGDFEGRKLIDSLRIKTKSQATNFRAIGLPS